MSEQSPAGIPSEDTPQPDAPEGVASDTPTPEGDGTAPDQQQAVDWEKRYRDVQRWATQLNEQNTQFQQRLAALEDPEQFRALLAERGYQLEDEGAPDTLADPNVEQLTQLQQQVADFAAWQQQQQQAQQREQAYGAYRADVDPQLQKMGLAEGLVDMAADIAFDHLPPVQTPDGPKPDLEGAVAQIKEMGQLFANHPDVRNLIIKDYRDSKRAPHIGQVGTAGEQAIPLDADHSTRVRMALERHQMNE